MNRLKIEDGKLHYIKKHFKEIYEIGIIRIDYDKPNQGGLITVNIKHNGYKMKMEMNPVMYNPEIEINLNKEEKLTLLEYLKIQVENE